jgi:AraC-like DNA-binding protein
MLKFYQKALVAFLLVALAIALMIVVGIKKSQLTASLFPGRDSDFMWAEAIEPSVPVDKTQLSVKSNVGTVEYEYFLDPEAQYPYVHYSFYFVDAVQPYRMVDLTKYSSITFRIICDPKNVLLFVLFSFDDKITDINIGTTRRVSSSAISCDNHWATVTVDFDELDTPQWWLGRYGFEYSDTGYHLNKTLGFAWVNSLQSPVNTPSRVKLTDVKIIGTDYHFVYAAVALSLCLLICYVFWLFRQYAVFLMADLRVRLKQDQPLIAYKKLSIEPQKDKEKSTVLRYLATEYANSELSIEQAAATLGINRSKINDILRDELGLTFSTYLNKLRLTEAARLLSENRDANISEIAYSVGYNNVTYFNKLFKTEYSCTPKTFKSLYESEPTDS